MEFFWSCDLILCVLLYQYTKFEPNPSILRKVSYFVKIQDGARIHLVSPKMIILVMLSTTCCYSAPAHQIWWEFAHPPRRNGTFMKFKLAAAAILNFG